MTTPAPLFALPPGGAAGADAGLVSAAQTTIAALRDQGALERHHELDAVIVLKLAEAVTESRGIAKSQMFGALLAARARLPEPVVAVIEPEALEYEGARAIEYFQAYSADVSNVQDAEPVD